MLLFLRPFFFLCHVTSWMQVLHQWCCTLIKSEASLETHLQKNINKKEAKEDRVVNTAATQTGMSGSAGAGSLSCQPEAKPESYFFFCFKAQNMIKGIHHEGLFKLQKQPYDTAESGWAAPVPASHSMSLTAAVYPSLPGRYGKMLESHLLRPRIIFPDTNRQHVARRFLQCMICWLRVFLRKGQLRGLISANATYCH